MLSGSDTESESDCASPLAWRADEFTQIATQAPHLSPDTNIDDADNQELDVGQAIDTLLTIDIQAIHDDSELHSSIQLASSVIFDFFGHIVREGCLEGAHARSSIAAILHVRFMKLLFDYRRIFHQLAARDLASGPSTSTVVCWVDVILTKIADVVVALAAHLPAESHLEPGGRFEGFNKQKEEDALRAATQLPAKWDKVPNLIGSERASPAATRLALRLTFAVYILGPKLGGGVYADDILPGELVKDLLKCVRRMSLDLSHHNIDMEQERIMYAMILCLLAAADHNHASGDSSPFLPHTIASILRCIRLIIHPNTELSRLDVLSPLTGLDGPQTILVKWGDVMPWCWKTWNDPRIASIESIAYLTANWLYHLASENSSNRSTYTTSDETWNIRVARQIAQDPSAAMGVMLRLLHHAISNLASSSTPTDFPFPTYIVLSRSLWVVVQLLYSTNDLTAFGSTDLCCIFLSLFILLGDTEHGIYVKDLLLEALVLIGPECVAAGLKTVQDDGRFSFTIKLDGVVARVTRLLSNGSIELSVDDCSKQVNLVLNYLAILWAAGAHGFLRRQTVTALLASLVDIHACDSPSVDQLALLPSLFTALARLERLRLTDPATDIINKLWEDEVLWQIAVDESRVDLLLASAFADYVCATASSRTCDALCFAEAWDYLRDVLLLILTSQFLDDQEALALLVSPVICGALLSLLNHADSKAVQFILSSPWTMNLCIGLRELVNDLPGRLSKYRSVLKSRLSSVAKTLLHRVIGHLMLFHGFVQ